MVSTPTNADDVPPTGDATIAAALVAMRKRYVETSRGIIATLDLVGEGLKTAPASDDLLTLLRRELHRVHGTSGSLGFHEASGLAGAMESLVRRWCDDPSLDRARRSAIVLNFSQTLQRAIAVEGDENESNARRLVLLGLDETLADRFVAEGMVRGLAVERMEVLDTAREPWAVVATATALDAAALDALGDAMCIVFHEASDAPIHEWPDHVHVVDARSPVEDILNALVVEDEGTPTTRGTAMIVDDDAMLLMLLSALAESDGFAVITATGAAGFHAELERSDPSLLVLDIELGDDNGIELLRALRAHPRHGTLPVMMLSGRSDSAARTAAFEAGADDYMLKPVVPPEFQQRLSRLAQLGREREPAAVIEQALAGDAAPDVIVVEDDPSLREMLSFALEARGLTHRAFSTGPDALEALLALPASDHPVVVLLDIDLPGMDGHSLHERLRVERPGVFHVVFISLHTAEADQLRALKGGALDYLIKPISLRVLIAKLDVWRERLRA